MPDEQSNLNLPAAARRPNNRRRGRRGGRGRAPRPTPGNAAAPDAEEIPPAPETGVESFSATENEAETTGAPKTESSAVVPETTAEPPTGEKPISESNPQPSSRPERERPARPERFERRHEPRSAKSVYVKPADFRPAETSAIHQAVVHATEIAESLKEMIDKIDEVLELVEVAERQKLADEREVDELRRALRRIQPPRQAQSPERERDHGRGQSRSRSESPRGRSESSRQNEALAETSLEPTDVQEPESPDQEPPSEP